MLDPRVKEKILPLYSTSNRKKTIFKHRESSRICPQGHVAGQYCKTALTAAAYTQSLIHNRMSRRCHISGFKCLSRITWTRRYFTRYTNFLRIHKQECLGRMHARPPRSERLLRQHNHEPWKLHHLMQNCICATQSNYGSDRRHH